MWKSVLRISKGGGPRSVRSTAWHFHRPLESIDASRQTVRARRNGSAFYSRWSRASRGRRAWG